MSFSGSLYSPYHIEDVLTASLFFSVSGQSPRVFGNRSSKHAVSSGSMYREVGECRRGLSEFEQLQFGPRDHLGVHEQLDLQAEENLGESFQTGEGY